MSFYEIVSLIGFLLGTTLHIVLSVLIAQRKHKTSSEFIFFALVISVAMWHLGNAISLLSLKTFGKNIQSVNYFSVAIAYAGIGFTPGLILHTAIAFIFEDKDNIGKKAKNLIISLVYLPMLPFLFLVIKDILLLNGVELETIVKPFLKPFVIWLISSLSIAMGIAMLSSRSSEEREEKRFLVFLFYSVVIFIIGLIGFTFLLEGWRINYIGSYLILASMLSSIFPSVLFSYFVYKYNYMEFVLRRSVFYSFLTLIVSCLYYFGIKQFCKYLQLEYSINPIILEATFVIGLVYLFPRLKERVQGLMRKLIFRRISDSEYILNDLSHVLSTDSLIDLPNLLEYITKSIKKATSIKGVSIFLFKSQRIQTIGDHPASTINMVKIQNIVKYFSSGDISILDRYETKTASIISEMRVLDAYFILPIFEGRKLIGLLSLGKSRRGLPLESDSLEQLMLIANQIGSAMGKVKLIDEKLQLERKIFESEKLSSLGRLSASVAHEVKNPLSSIKSIVQVMQEDLDKYHPGQEGLSIIVNEINRLTKVVNQLLLFARPGKETRGDIELDKVVESILSILNNEAKGNNIKIICKISADLPTINVNEGSLKEILFNLIYNAIESMTNGGALTITAEIDNSNYMLQIGIADTGPGIPEEIRDKIFEPFFTTKQSGTGLGLSIVKKKLEEMDGDIYVESNSCGSKFLISLPICNGNMNIQDYTDPIAIENRK